MPALTRVTIGLLIGLLAGVAAGQTAPPSRAAASEALRTAVTRGDVERVRALLSREDAVGVANQSERDGTTALHWAVRGDDLVLTDLLLRASADVDATTRYGVTPLSLAVLNGSAPVAARLLEAGADPNAASEDGETPLLTAARTGVTGTVALLLAAGADVDARESWRGQTPLMWAAAEGHGAVARELIAYGAHVGARSTRGFTPLLFAVRAGDLETVRVLLASGAELTETAPDGTGVLVLAIINAHFELAAVLLEAGANPNAEDPRGSPLHALAWVRRPGTPSTTSVLPRRPTGVLDSLSLAERLLEAGADPNARIAWREPPYNAVAGRVRVPPDISVAPTYLSWVGATPFFLAAKQADVPLMRLLVASGADPNLATPQNITPLMAAAGLGYWEAETPGTEAEALAAVRLAVGWGADVNARTDFSGPPLGDMRWGGSTALHGAVIRNAPSIVRYLVEQGARLDTANAQGWTPHDLTRGVFVSNTEKTFHEIGALLEELSALAP